MRQKVMESLGETLKRSGKDSEESGEEKKRSKCSEAIDTYRAKMSKVSS